LLTSRRIFPPFFPFKATADRSAPPPSCFLHEVGYVNVSLLPEPMPFLLAEVASPPPFFPIDSSTRAAPPRRLSFGDFCLPIGCTFPFAPPPPPPPLFYFSRNRALPFFLDDASLCNKEKIIDPQLFFFLVVPGRSVIISIVSNPGRSCLSFFPRSVFLPFGEPPLQSDQKRTLRSLLHDSRLPAASHEPQPSISVRLAGPCPALPPLNHDRLSFLSSPSELLAGFRLPPPPRFFPCFFFFRLPVRFLAVFKAFSGANLP